MNTQNNGLEKVMKRLQVWPILGIYPKDPISPSKAWRHFEDPTPAIIEVQTHPKPLEGQMILM